MKRIFSIILLTFIFVTSAEAAVWWYKGILYGNVCIVPHVGWQVVRPQPVGSNCYSDMHQAWGFIANQ